LGLPIKQGVLLGARRYTAHALTFAAGQILTIAARPIYRDESGMGSFDCAIFSDDTLLAQATVNVFEPEDFAVFLQKKKPS